MFSRRKVNKRTRPKKYQVQQLSGPADENAGADDFMALGNTPAWRSLLRFLVLGLMAIGAMYLSAISLNILILGTDDVDYSKHTDTIILVHWNPLPRRLSLLSIPRDTYIQMPKRGPMKINAVYAYGNALGSKEYALAMTRAAIETLLGTKIHYVIHINYTDFIRLVDDMGGIPITIDKSMHYVDQAGGLNIQLEQGARILDGRQALDYVRFRHDLDGDLGRIRRQQKFLRAFVAQLLNFSKISNTLSAFRTFLHEVETNLNGPTAVFLAMEIKGVARKSWQEVILPGEPVYIDGKAYWKPDLQGIRRTLAELGHAAKPRPSKPGADSVEVTPVPAQPEPGKQPVVPQKIAAAAEPAAAEPAPAVSQPKPAKPTKPLGLQPPKPAVHAQATAVALPKPALKKVLAPMPAGHQPIIRVLNGCGVSGVASRLTQRLLGGSIQVRAQDCTNAPNFGFSQTIIKSKAKNLPWARRIATILKLSEDRIQVIPENINYPSVTIVIGGDYQELLK